MVNNLYHKVAHLVHLVEGVVGDRLVGVVDLLELDGLAHLRRRLQQRLLKASKLVKGVAPLNGET